MKLKLFLFLLLLFSFQKSAIAQTSGLLANRFAPTRAEHKIESIRRLSGSTIKNGEIEFYTDTEAFFNPKGQLLELIKVLPNYTYNFTGGKEITIYDYDEKGRKIKYIKKYEFDQTHLNRVDYDIKYEYDDKENIVIAFYYNADGSLKKTEKSTLESAVLSPGDDNTDNNNLSVKAFNNNPKFETLYDSIARRYTYREFNARKKVLFEKKIQLDERNRITQIIKDDFTIREFTTATIRYDDFGNEIERIEVNTKTGKVVNKYFNTFYKNGLLAQTTWTTDKEKLIQVIKYEYFYY